MNTRRHKLWLAGVSAAVAAVVVVAAIAVAAGRDKSGPCSPSFDASAWHGSDAARTAEAHRLVDCGRLVGRSRSSIRRLLGKPDERDGKRALAYELGPDSLGIDSQYLEVVFSGGRATRAHFFTG